MKKLRVVLALVVPTALTLITALAARPARAFPAFARKYGMSCSACHLAWPIFGPEGQNFRDNGYQLNLGKDDPVTLSPAYVPFAIRTTAAYQFTRTTHQASATGPVTVQTGGVPLPPGVDLLTGGLIAKDISYLVVISGFGPDNGASVESAWARLDNLGGTGWLNFRIGKFELDQPASSHRGIALTSGYAVYSAKPDGSVVGFDYAENQVGVELDGHDARSLTRYSLSFTSASGGEGLSSNGWSAPMVYGHVQRAFELGTPVVPWVRVGALGGVGWWPTAFDQAPPNEDGSPGGDLPGTGRDHRKFYRAGAELAWMMGHPTTPALATVAYIHGSEDAGLAGDGSRSNSFDGGFAEIDWVPFTVASYVATPWVFFGRYDLVRYQRGAGDLDGVTIGARRYLALGPRASAAIHVEGHYDRAKGIGFNGDGITRDVETTSAIAGIDFDF
jgi:hypothetical protein